MNRRTLKVSALILSGILCMPLAAMAASSKSNGKGPGGGKKGTRQLTVSPSSMSMVESSSGGMSVCVAGFSEGNFVMVGVPWIGSPDSHSNLSFSGYVDSTGGFCRQLPPDWTTFQLEPGTYTIISYFYASATSSNRRDGPKTTFEVLTNQ